MVQRGVAETGSEPAGTELPELDWTDLKYFLAVAEHASIRVAAKSLGTYASTVKRHIDSMERILNEPLFYRSPYGMMMTEFGKVILEDAMKARDSFTAIERKARGALKEVQGKVRLAVTEGVGGSWLLPHLIEFQRSFPNVTLETQCGMTFADILRLNAEISVQLKKPEDPDLIQSRLGRLHLSFFASRRYLEMFGKPKSIADLKSHKLVTQYADQVEERLFLQFARIDDPRGVVAFRTNSSIGAYTLVDRGAGIGVLPTYIMALGVNLVPIDLGERHSEEIWLVYHPDVKRTRSHELVIDAIRRSFDTARYPWFGEAYMPPQEIAALPRDAWAHMVPTSVAI
ncbi:MAG: LysR family transcriptional regulator [Alphaproteobacteria bacterium]